MIGREAKRSVGSAGSEPPRHRGPWCNRAVILVTLGVSACQPALGWVGGQMMLSASDPRLWQFFSYALVHEGLVHLVGNLLALSLFGGVVNVRLGHLGYLGLYLSGAVFAGTAWLATARYGFLLGASGSAGAVMGAYLAAAPRGVLQVGRAGGRHVCVPGWAVIAAYFLFNLWMSFHSSGTVAYQAHVAGILYGFALARGLLAAAPPRVA